MAAVSLLDNLPWSRCHNVDTGTWIKWDKSRICDVMPGISQCGKRGRWVIDGLSHACCPTTRSAISRNYRKRRWLLDDTCACMSFFALLNLGQSRGLRGVMFRAVYVGCKSRPVCGHIKQLKEYLQNSMKLESYHFERHEGSVAGLEMVDSSQEPESRDSAGYPFAGHG